jgi:hypothetical protein
MRRGDFSRDPLDILIEREEARINLEKRTCKGCKHIGWVEIGEKRVTICNIRNKFDNRKCTAYKLRGEE